MLRRLRCLAVVLFAVTVTANAPANAASVSVVQRLVHRHAQPYFVALEEVKPSNQYIPIPEGEPGSGSGSPTVYDTTTTGEGGGSWILYVAGGAALLVIVRTVMSRQRR